MKTFFIRILQVNWILSGVFFAYIYLSENQRYDALMLFHYHDPIVWNIIGLIWCVILIIVQYLVFGTPHPLDLFDGALLEKGDQK